MWFLPAEGRWHGVCASRYCSRRDGRIRWRPRNRASHRDIYALPRGEPGRGSLGTGPACPVGSHAFYELKGTAVLRCLQEIARSLKKNRRFLMMEHDPPKNPLIRILFYVRVFSMGRKKALDIPRNEEQLFRRYFESVERVAAETGRSKILIGRVEW